MHPSIYFLRLLLLLRLAEIEVYPSLYWGQRHVVSHVTIRYSHTTTFTPKVQLEFPILISYMCLNCRRKPDHANASRTCKLHKERPQQADGFRTVKQQRANRRANVLQLNVDIYQVISGKKDTEVVQTLTKRSHLWEQLIGLGNPLSSLNHNAPACALLLLAPCCCTSCVTRLLWPLLSSTIVLSH